MINPTTFTRIPTEVTVNDSNYKPMPRGASFIGAKKILVSYMSLVSIKPGVKNAITSDMLFCIIENFYKIKRYEFLNTIKRREIIEPRQIFCYFMRKYNSNYTLAQIGDFIDKDHSTVLHSIRTINNLIETNKIFQQKIDTIEGKIKEVFYENE